MENIVDFFRYLIIIFSDILFASGYPVNPYCRNTGYIERYVNEVTNEFVSIAGKEFNLSCSGSGASMPEDIESISVFFNSPQKGTIPLARELEVKLAEKFLNIINHHPKIAPFLREYPFTPARIDISISFSSDNPQQDSVIQCVLVNNKIHYGGTTRYVNIAVETFEEADKIVHQGGL